jgi:predicted aspartyl protease
MRFDGEWLLCDDRVVRPVLRCEILSVDGSWCAAELLIDTGADLTVLSANVLETLDWKGHAAERSIGGIGGTAECVAVTTQLRFTRADFVQVVFRGAYLACADPRALDMSVLGRDILEMFAVIVDYSGDTVCLLGGRHRYSITNP